MAALEPMRLQSAEPADGRLLLLVRVLARRRLARLCLLPLCLAPAAAADAAERPWLEARSPHFLLVGDVSAGAARDTLFRFEQLRAVFANLGADMRLDPGQPFTIVAARNADSFHELLLAAAERKGRSEVAGIYLRGPYRHLAVLRTDAEDEDYGIHSVAFHEYAHFVLALNLPPLPLWLAEGLAELYAHTSIRKDKVMLGRPSPAHVALLRQEAPLPLAKLIEVDHDSPLYNEDSRVSVFYAQSWALVHYLQMGDRGARQDVIQRLLESLATGASPAEASRQALGDLEALSRALAAYLHNQQFFYQTRPAVPLKEKEIATRPLAPGEALAWRGAVHVAMSRPEDARAALARALAQAPTSALAHETLATLARREERLDEARAHAGEAVRLDPASASAQLLHGELALVAGGGGTAVAVAAFEAATTAAPAWAAAWSSLADARLMAGADVREVLPPAQRAVALEPGVVRHRFTLAQALLHAGEKAEAAAVARRARATSTEDERRQLDELLARAEGVPLDAARAAAEARSLEQNCALDAPAACEALAYRFEEGTDGAPADAAAALPLYDKACRLGRASACVRAGLLHEHGKGTPKDFGAAAPYYSKACDAGDAWGCYDLGLLHRYGRPGPADPARAAALFDRACGAERPEACERLAELLWNGEGVARDEARATGLWERGCQAELVDSCRLLAHAYVEGRGRDLDPARGASMLLDLCAKQSAAACSDLALLHVSGTGVARDPGRAGRLLDEACRAGFAPACDHLIGLLESRGSGIRDPARAKAVRQEACARGLRSDCGAQR